MSPIAKALVVSFLASLALLACGNEQSTTLKIRPVIPTSSDAVADDVSTVFWNAMAVEGAAAGMHDGYQACIHPDLGVTVFDIDQFGTLVNPAFDAGYVAGSTAIADSCAALTEDYLATSAGRPDAGARHRVATVGVNYDTLDAHPDFGKGFDVGEAVGISLPCDVYGFEAAAPPDDWVDEYPSEFQSGYATGLKSLALTCADAAG